MKPAAFLPLAAWITCLALPSAGGAQAARSAGQYAVGFRTLAITDGARVGVSGQSPRVWPASIWYPAAANSGQHTTFGYWIDQLGRSVAATTAAGDSVFVRRAADLGGNADSIQLALPRLRRLATASVVNATASAGRFPLIVFPEYSAPATTSVMAERLASRGYVVVSIPLRGTLSGEPDISTRGLETVALDVMATVQRMKQLSNVDGTHVGAVGVGITASALLAAHLMSPDIQSLVSLEGGITTQFELDMIKRSAYFDPGRVRVPMLAITAPHPSVDARRLDEYRYAPQWRLHYERMGEFWFLNYGWLDQYLPGIIGAAPGDAREGFMSAESEIARFFGATLRPSGELSQALSGTSVNFGASFHAARPAPPTVVALLQQYRRSGVSALVEALERRRAGDPEILPVSYFAELVNGVAGTDAEWRARSAIATLWIAGHPQSARARRVAALAALAVNDSASARAHVADALRTLNDDPDPTFQFSSLRQAALEQLRALAERLHVLP